MKYWNIILLLAILLFFGVGCKSKNKGQNNTDLKKKSSKYIFEKTDKYHLDAEWFSAKSSVKLIQNNQTTKATAYIRMREDSVIWASVKKLGFEGGRILITPDSVFLINRLDKNYIAKPFSYIRNMTGLSSTGNNLSDFRNLYDLVLGNVVLKSEGKYDVKTQDSKYILSKEEDFSHSEYWVNGNNFTLNKMKISQTDENREAICTFMNYKSLTNNNIFSYIRNLNLYSVESGKLNIELNFSKVSIDDPVSIRFSIPKSYEEAK